MDPSDKKQSDHLVRDDCLTEAPQDESKSLRFAEVKSADSTSSVPASEEQDKSERKTSSAQGATALIPEAGDTAATGQKLCCSCRRLTSWIQTDFLDDAGELKIEKAPSFEELIASFREEDAAETSRAERRPQEPTVGHSAQSLLPGSSSEKLVATSLIQHVPACSLAATSASPSVGSVSALTRLSLKDEMLPTGGKSYGAGSPDPLGHPQIKDPSLLSGSLTSARDELNRAQETETASKKHEQPMRLESESCSPMDTSPTKLNKRALDREMEDVFKELCRVITTPSSSLDEMKALAGKLRDNGYSLDSSSGSMVVSPLVLAALENRVDAASLLLEHGADPNASLPHMSSVTALHVACSHGASCDTLSLVSLLLQRGASLKSRTARGDTPLAMARAAGNIALVQYLENQALE